MLIISPGLAVPTEETMVSKEDLRIPCTSLEKIRNLGLSWNNGWHGSPAVGFWSNYGVFISNILKCMVTIDTLI